MPDVDVIDGSTGRDDDDDALFPFIWCGMGSIGTSGDGGADLILSSAALIVGTSSFPPCFIYGDRRCRGGGV